MKEVDKVVLLITFLTDKYDVMTKLLMLGKETLSVKDVIAMLIKYERLKKLKRMIIEIYFGDRMRKKQ